MKVDGRHFRSIWLEPDGWSVGAIDQRRLPHEFVVARLTTCEEAAEAIRGMLVRGAPLIGATAAYRHGAGDAAGRFRRRARARRADAGGDPADRDQPEMGAGRACARRCSRWRRPARGEAAYARADEIAEEDVVINQGIGQHGLDLIESDRRDQAARRAGQCADPLQCRLARHRRLGHRDRADLSGA